ncbi:hypothetical protein CDEST_07604 [Colletotrichum destructivum]|uniref:Uncharacterized protein n=1 Tax=Colletotrichum destructivum TaxID=34406 RepID=A0AAX4IHR4_9PEZI|nr:hypothetical protein CDEST_07604 [Colletotrichum destructivum]
MPSQSPWGSESELQISGAHDQGLADLSQSQQAEWPAIALRHMQRFHPEPTERHAGAARKAKAQPVGADFMHLIEGDYWPETYGPTHELGDPVAATLMAGIQAPPVAAHRGSHSNHRARPERYGSGFDSESSSSSDVSKQPALDYTRHTPLSLQRDHSHDAGPQRRKTKAKAERDEFAPQRPASSKVLSTATPPVCASSHGRRRHSTARYEDTDDDCLESRLERVLHIVEDNGFDSIDSMTSTYYTSELSEDCFLRPMQATSRTRRLRSLLSDLQASHKSWTERERSAYAEEMVRSAEGICSDELGALYGSRAPLTSPLRRRASSTLREPSLQDQQSAGLHTKRREIARRIREVLSSLDISEFLQKDQAALQTSVPETWSMMIELARRAGLQPHERVMVACINVYLLTDYHSS